MPEQETIERAREDAREGKSPSTQAGEFVREEMEHIREGKHGARSAKQAIAIGLSKARRAGVQLPPPKKERPHDERENRRSATSPRAAAEASDLPPSVPALLRTRLNVKAVPRHHTGHYPGKRIRPRNAAALPIDPAPLKKRREHGSEIVRHSCANHCGNTQTTFCGAEKYKKSRESSGEKGDNRASAEENSYRARQGGRKSRA